ncbi:hypothetical protein L6164_029102 [Bauhinia variegata]|uniref:Uncharacterized protein n=1 Tax=Bauhinia variegata TaxID=167791 RepID=A0ACB9L7N5_BAUVA|nr:hypothetical protein L6164_029102 [Bauhinia variegata]
MEVNNKGTAPPANDSDASPAVHKDATAMVANNKDAVPPATTLPPAVGKNTVKKNVLLSSDSDDDKFDDDEFSDDEGTPMIDKYGTNLTKLAQEGKRTLLDGKEELVERVIQILCRRNKHSPCLIGYPGVWKTSIIEGLAKRIQSGMVPQRLKDKKVISFTANETRSFGICHPGNPMSFPWSLVMNEIKRSGDMIVFFDEHYTLSNVGFSQSAVAKGDIQCIGATHHLGEYTTNSVLRGLLQAVEVPEPSTDEAIKILKGVCGSYETHHKVSYTEEALVAAVKLSSEYIISKYNEPLLDMAIDLVDEAGSRVQLLQGQAIYSKNKDQSSQLNKLKSTMKIDTYHNNDDKPTMVRKKDVLHVLSSRIGIPVHEFPPELPERLLRLEETLHGIIIGQGEAFAAIGDAIRRSKVGLKGFKKPIASFLFTGPVGVGKTEVAKVLAKQCFGSEDFIVQFDMNVYKEKHQVSRLIGSPPGYIGAQLTEAIRFKPQTVLLFSNIEAAHPDILDFMLQILDDAMLKDKKGYPLDFTRTMIIFTSNVGSEVINKRSSHKADKGKIDNLVMEKVKKCFRAEFLNRIDEVIIFKQPSKKEVTQIADLMFQEVGNKLKGKGIKLIVSDKFKKTVVKDGYSPSHGARHLRRVITEQLENHLARQLLSKEIKDGDSVFVDVGFGANKKVLDEPSFEGKKNWCCLFG